MEADMTRILAALVGALMAVNGIIMVVDPPAWYASVPGGWKVSATGTLFFALHALLHAVERLAGHHHGALVDDLVAIHLPTAIAAGVTWIQFRAATKGRTT
jgi:hypothetical protein